MTDELADIINDDNFIALMHFAAHYANNVDAETLLKMVKFLALISGHIVGEFKSNFFVSKCTALFHLGLQDHYCREGSSRSEQEITWYTLRMLRIIASVHPISNKDLGHSAVLDDVLVLLQKHAEINEKILREVLALINTLSGNNLEMCIKVKRHVPLSLLRSLVSRKLLSVYDIAVDLFLILFEGELMYDDQKMQYVVSEWSEEGQFVALVLSELTYIVKGKFNEDNENPVFAGLEADPAPYMEFWGRTLNKLERSLRVISSQHIFLKQKLAMLELLKSLFHSPRHISARYLAAIDVFSLLYSGAAGCWVNMVGDVLDSEFLHLSHKLVEDFLALTNDRIFDNRDRNSLHYLAGSDTLSTIQNMITQSSSFTADHVAQSPHLVRTLSFRSRRESSDSNELLRSPEKMPDSTEIYLKEMAGLCNYILKDAHVIRDIATDWERHSNETNIRKLVYTYLVSLVVGWEKLQHFIPCAADLPNSILSLVAEERYRMKNTPGLEKKLMEIIGSLVETMGSFELSMDCCSYLIKVITSKPEGLTSSSDRYQSEFLRQEVVRDATSENVNELGVLLRSSSMGAPRLTITSEMLDHCDLHYAAMTALISLCNQDRSVRRKLVSACTEIIQSLFYFAPVDPINHRPVLHLIKTMLEFIPKVEINAEEAIVSVIIRSLHSPLLYNKAQACDLIYQIGQESPGFVFRGLSRLEIEDALVDMMHVTCEYNYSQLLLSALKGISALVHNPNIKPTWLPLPWLYHWSKYRPTLEHRILLSVQGLSLIISALKNVDVSYRLPVFTFTLSAAASLMYACVDDVLRPTSPDDVERIRSLKEMLISNILPWLPIAMDFITLGKKKKKGRDHSDSIVAISTPYADKSEGSKAHHCADMMSIEAGQMNAFVVRFSGKHTTTASPSANAAVYTSQAVEALTEKTLEALYAFLCTDEMIPLSTYITYIRLFEQSPLIASVSYFMTENKNNLRIMRRGIDFLRYFAENEMNLSIIAMHTPAALMAALNALKDTIEVQLSFCKVILKIASMDDDFARENLIRFGVHVALIEMINAHHHPLTLLAMQATTALAANEINAYNMSSDTMLIETLLGVIETMPKNMAEQVEALHTLIWLDRLVADLVSNSPKRSLIFNAMKRSRKLITTYMQAKKMAAGNGIRDDLDPDRVQQILDDPIWRLAGCVIS
ncbi:hypothetical protein EON65_12790 [archaeon]|nr:MAG: hypothetical protein EON65_12790 [archaeon]